MATGRRMCRSLWVCCSGFWLFAAGFASMLFLNVRSVGDTCSFRLPVERPWYEAQLSRVVSESTFLPVLNYGFSLFKSLCMSICRSQNLMKITNASEMTCGYLQDCFLHMARHNRFPKYYSHRYHGLLLAILSLKTLLTSKPTKAPSSRWLQCPEDP